MFVFCLTWLTITTTNMFVVQRKQFSKITNVHEQKHV